MFFSTVSHGKIAYCWKTTPRRWSGPVTVDAVARDLAGVRTQEAGGHVEQRRLAAAGGAEHADELTGRDVEGDPVEDVEAALAGAEAEPDVVEGDRCRARGAAHRTTRSCQRTVTHIASRSSRSITSAEIPIRTMPAKMSS